LRKKRLLAAGLLLAGLALALSGAEVMQKVAAKPRPATMHGKMEMRLVDKHGRELTRVLETWSKQEGDVEKKLIKFLAPADVKGTSFLVISRNGQDEMKLYLPALKRVRRIAGGQKKGSFMGSDFSYDDISNLGKIEVDDYENKLLREEELNGAKTYVVEARPKAGVDSSYDKQVLWVRADDFVPVRIEFYQKGKLVKVMTLDHVQKFAGGKYLMPTHMVMENVKSKHKTELTMSDLELDVDIPDSVFSERFMKR